MAFSNIAVRDGQNHSGQSAGLHQARTGSHASVHGALDTASVSIHSTTTHAHDFGVHRPRPPTHELWGFMDTGVHEVWRCGVPYIRVWRKGGSGTSPLDTWELPLGTCI